MNISETTFTELNSPQDNFDSVELLKLTRLVRLARVFQKIERFSQYSAVILSLLMICFILISHWLACIFIVIGRYQVGAGDEGWMDQLAVQNKLDNKTLISHLESFKIHFISLLYFLHSGFLHDSFILHQLIIDHHWLRECFGEHKRGKDIFHNHNVHRR